MKAKIKLELKDNGFTRNLDIDLKLEKEWFYWHTKTVVGERVYENDEFVGFKSEECFYGDVIKYLSNINNAIEDGKEFMKEIVESKAKELKANSKEKEAIELLKKLKQPIQIEIEK